MTPQRAKELLPVIQAFAEGKKVQVRFNAAERPTWMDTEKPAFTDDGEYRIKPQPREWWIYDTEGRYVAFPTKITGAIHVREVLE